MNLRRFDLLFIRGDSLLSHTIEAVTHSPYSHIAIALDEWHIAETDWRYPLQVRHLNYRPDEYDVYRYQGSFTASQLQALDTFLHSSLNTPYDWIQSVTNGLHLLTGLPIQDSPKRMNCSETVDRMFAAARIDLCAGIDGQVTPADLSRSVKLQKISQGAA